MTSATISQQIISIAEQLEGFSSLSPRAEVNNLFSALVDLVIQTPGTIATEVLATSVVQTVVPQLQLLSAQGESALELYWAEKFLAKLHISIGDLEEFPYFANYEALTALEMTALQKHNLLTEPILFVGGGPLPLTAILLAHRYGIRFRVIDCDAKAVLVSTRLIQKLGLENLILVECVDLRDVVIMEKTIFLASLVGGSISEKQQLFTQLAQKIPHDATVVSRSVQGLGELLYVPKPSTSEFIDVETFMGTREIINTVVISRKI